MQKSFIPPKWLNKLYSLEVEVGFCINFNKPRISSDIIWLKYIRVWFFIYFFFKQKWTNICSAFAHLQRPEVLRPSMLVLLQKLMAMGKRCKEYLDQILRYSVYFRKISKCLRGCTSVVQGSGCSGSPTQADTALPKHPPAAKILVHLQRAGDRGSTICDQLGQQCGVGPWTTWIQQSKTGGHICCTSPRSLLAPAAQSHGRPGLRSPAISPCCFFMDQGPLLPPQHFTAFWVSMVSSALARETQNSGLAKYGKSFSSPLKTVACACLIAAAAACKDAW